MRLRLQTAPPLPDLKAWFVPDVHQIPNSIAELKVLLCSNVAVLKNAGVTRQDIKLFLDDFELLNESPFAAALRDGDLLCVKFQGHFAQKLKTEEDLYHDHHQEPLVQRKRKRIDEKGQGGRHGRKMKARKIVHSRTEEESGVPLASSGSSSSTTSTSSSSSSSSTSSSSSSSSPSSSDQSDSESSLPSSKASKLAPRPPVLRNIATPALSISKSKSGGPFVPPGHGKSTTHARNLRRKRQRTTRRTESLLKAQTPTLPPGVISQTNAVPLGERINSRSVGSSNGEKEEEEGAVVDGDQAEHAEPLVMEKREIMMASLGNKNKKKGYKQFLMAPVPKKIVFTEEGEAAISASVSASEPQKPVPRLVPPSEIQERGELPPNMFVTSVDVEADLWKSSGRKKKKGRGQETEISGDYDYLYHDGNERQVEEDIMLSYEDEGIEIMEGMADDTRAGLQVTNVGPAFDWNQAEQLFANAPDISHQDDLKTAEIVGWKSLELNPQTFTPEIILIAAKVLEWSEDPPSVKIQRLLRPVDPFSASSGFLAPVDSDAESDEKEEEFEEHLWSDVLAFGWRVLQT